MCMHDGRSSYCSKQVGAHVKDRGHQVLAYNARDMLYSWQSPRLADEDAKHVGDIMIPQSLSWGAQLPWIFAQAGKAACTTIS